MIAEIGLGDGFSDPCDEDLGRGGRLRSLHLLGFGYLDVTPAIHDHVTREQDLVLHLKFFEADECVTWN